MSHVYRVGSVFGTQYFNTAKEAARCKPGDEEPETFDRLDAAETCNDLDRALEESERSRARLLTMLEGLWEVCPLAVIDGTEVGRQVDLFISENVLSKPSASGGARGGQQSYGV